MVLPQEAYFLEVSLIRRGVSVGVAVVIAVGIVVVEGILPVFVIFGAVVEGILIGLFGGLFGLLAGLAGVFSGLASLVGLAAGLLLLGGNGLNWSPSMSSWARRYSAMKWSLLIWAESRALARL